MSRPASIAGPVTILGAGNAGSALAAGLVAAGAGRVVLWARDARQGRRRAKTAGATFQSDLGAAIAHGDLLLLAVSDEAVSRLARQVGAHWPEGPSPPVVLHTAGALSAAALEPLAGDGVATGVFHPVVSLLGTGSASRLRGGFATISGSEPALRAARQLASLLGMQALRVDDDRRPLVHMAAVMAAGDLTALLASAEDLLEEAGVAPAKARQLLAHLAGSALESYKARGAGRSITGPSARGDGRTLAAHLKAAAASPAGRRAVLAHRLLARQAAERVHGQGRLDRAGLLRIRRLLGSAR